MVLILLVIFWLVIMKAIVLAVEWCYDDDVDCLNIIKLMESQTILCKSRQPKKPTQFYYI